MLKRLQGPCVSVKGHYNILMKYASAFRLPRSLWLVRGGSSISPIRPRNIEVNCQYAQSGWKEAFVRGFNLTIKHKHTYRTRGFANTHSLQIYLLQYLSYFNCFFFLTNPILVLNKKINKITLKFNPGFFPYLSLMRVEIIHQILESVCRFTSLSLLQWQSKHLDS